MGTNIYASQSKIKEQEMLIDGVIFKEKEDSRTEIKDGKETTTSTMTRSIGNKVYEVKTVVQDKITKEEKENTKLSPDEIAAFKKEWEDKWKPVLESTDAIKMLKGEQMDKNTQDQEDKPRNPFSDDPAAYM